MSFKTYMPVTPQSEPAREDQVKNNAGGFVFKINPLQKLTRFLILGTTGGTYYQSEREITLDNIVSLNHLFETLETGKEAVDLIVTISEEGRAPKNDPALAALALATVSKNAAVRSYAMEFISRVARIPTHLNHLVAYREAFGGGWGRNFKTAIQNWYNNKSADRLSFLMAKYQSRDGWSHKDILRLAHPVPISEAHNILYKWALGNSGLETFGMVKGLEKMQELLKEAQAIGSTQGIIEFYTDAKQIRSRQNIIDNAINLIDAYKMPFEVVPSEFLKEPEIWAHLLPNLGFTSLIRSLARMAQAGYLVPGNTDAVRQVVARLGNSEALQKARVHPIQILSAARTYGGGKGVRSNGEWTPVPAVVAALDKAFYASFQYVETTNKRYYIGVDCSGSMGGGEIAGVPGLTPREAAGVMAMVFLKREPFCTVRGFTSAGGGWGGSTTGMLDLGLNKDMSLGEVCKAISRADWGSTDCSLPILDAAKQGLKIDCFMTLTDNETWASPNIHPFQALVQYRQKTEIDAKNVVIAFTAADFTIADPLDPNSFDCVGFDSSAPAIIGEFAQGKL